MQLLIECLPLFAGPLVLLVFKLSRSIVVRRISLALIPFLVAFITNQISGEGIGFLIVDVLKACGSTVIVLFLSGTAIRSRGR